MGASRQAVAMALSIPECNARVDHLVKLINGMATEQVDEINDKAQQDYEMEKARICDETFSKMKAEYSRRDKRMDAESKIAFAKENSRSKMTVLQVQSDYVDSVIAEAKAAVPAAISNKAAYTKMLEGLISQGLAKLLDSNVTLRCKESDLSQVESAIPSAVSAFLAAHGKPGAKCDVTVNKSAWLPASESGGVILVGSSGKVQVDNTFSARMEIAAEQLMPQMKSMLFGKYADVLHAMKENGGGGVDDLLS